MVEHVLKMEGRRDSYRDFKGRPEGKRRLGGARSVWAYDLEIIGWESGLNYSGSR